MCTWGAVQDGCGCRSEDGQSHEGGGPGNQALNIEECGSEQGSEPLRNWMTHPESYLAANPKELLA